MTSKLRPAVEVWREAFEAWACEPEHDNAPEAAAAVIEADREAVRAYWYRQGKDDGVEQERGNIVEWLMREEEGYPSGEYSGFAAMIREAIEAGEHLK